MPETNAKLLLTIQEFARTYNMGRSTVYKLITENKLPFVHVGSRRYIRWEDAETWRASLAPRKTASTNTDIPNDVVNNVSA
jgi:excisionase family DNA binding protein